MKKLFALLLVLVMVIAIVPAAAAAEVEGTPSAVAGQETPGDPKGDENPGNPENPGTPENPGNPENPENPKNPGDPENPENPGDPENPGNPENPDTPATCKHEHTSWIVDDQSHAEYCDDCNKTISAYEPHTYDSTHHCTVCGRPEPNPECAHKNIAYSPAGSEGHVKYCSDCFADLSDIEPHHRVGNVCDLCGFDKFDCSHEHTVWSYNDNYHHLLCKDCNTIIDDGEHVGMNDGICDKCGFKTNAEHHFLPGSHDCTDPGCNYRSFCSDPNGDGKCDTCGAPGHFGDVIWKDLDDNSHEAICSECKESMWTASHYDDDNDGKCDACGHKMSGTTGGGTTGGKENTGLDKVPKTGDVMAPMAILSGLMSVAAVFTRKRFF